MRFNIVLRYMGMVLLLNAVFMLIAAIISLFNGIDTGFYPLLLSFVLTAALGSFPLIFVGGGEQISNKEGYVIVVSAWLTSCLVGAFPYLLWGGGFGIENAWFESVSGFSTTGATILDQVEVLPKGLLFWRSSTLFLGGMGVVLFAMVILPSLGRTKIPLSGLETSSLARTDFKYRMRVMLRILLGVYAGMAVVETFLLRMAGMDWFDAVNHAFSTVSLGGFSTRTLNIAYYDNVAIEVIIMAFMLLTGIHFGVVFATVSGKANHLFRSEVSRYYLITVAVFTAVVTLSLWLTERYPDLLTSLRYGAFEVIAMASTAAFATADATLWTPFSIVLLIFLAIQGGCAGSTASGLKTDRVLLAGKVVRAQIKQQQHPNAVIRIKMNGVIQDETQINFAMIFIVIFVSLLMVGTVIFALFGLDIVTSFSVSFGSLCDIGRGFGQVGAMSNYGVLPTGAKFVSSLWMLLGRLEIFGLMQLFFLKWWK